MTDSAVPADVESFVRDNVESYEQLEVLLLLFERSAEAWSAQEVESELQMDRSTAKEALRFLFARGLLGARGSSAALSFCYQPATPALARMVERVVAVQADQRVAIMKLMTTNAIERLRTVVRSEFPRAFLFADREYRRE